MDQSEVKLKQEILSVLTLCLPQYISKEFQMERLCGLTNETYKLIFEDLKPIVWRKLSPVINRKIEGAIIEELSRRKIAPHCYFTSMDYRVEEFLQNAEHPYCFQILERQQIVKPIVQKLAQLHQTQMPPTIPTDVLADTMFSKENEMKYMSLSCHIAYNLKQFDDLKERIMKQFESMRQWVAKNFSHKGHLVRFCHNDLHSLNCFTRDIGENKKQALLIDFQYAAFNYIPYDIANFMNETSIWYGIEKPGYKIGRKLQWKDIQKICSYYDLGYEGMEKDIGKMLMLVNYYWALWTLTIEPTPSSPSFQPLSHGVARMDLYDFYKSKYDN